MISKLCLSIDPKKMKAGISEAEGNSGADDTLEEVAETFRGAGVDFFCRMACCELIN